MLLNKGRGKKIPSARRQFPGPFLNGRKKKRKENNCPEALGGRPGNLTLVLRPRQRRIFSQSEFHIFQSFRKKKDRFPEKVQKYLLLSRMYVA